MNRKSRQSKAVSIGWMHFNYMKERYVCVNENKGGGVRPFTFSSNASGEHILSKAKETFFNKKTTLYGHKEDLKFFLGNFQGKVIDTKKFILQDYITSNKLTKTRLFLLSKPKSKLKFINDMIQDDVDFGDDLDDIFPSVSNIAFSSATSASLETNSNTINLSESSMVAGDLNNAEKVYDASNENEARFKERRVLPTFENATSHSAFVPSPVSTILSSVAVSNELQSFTEIYVPNDERFTLLNELQQPYATDTSIDLEAIKEEELKQKAVALQEHQRSRLPPEPRNLESKVTLSVRHPEFGTLRRSFLPDAAMNVAYDWVGSLCSKPMYFGLYSKDCHKPVPPPSNVKLYDKTVLNLGILNQPLDFQEDCEITMPGYSNSLTKCIGTIEAKRDTEKFKLKNDTGSCFYVDRHNIVHDILQMYQDKAVTDRYVTIKFRDENALGDGVSRDVYTQFYKDVFRLYSSGIHENVPVSFSKRDSEVFGRIITHAFIQYNIFPIEIARAFFEQLLTNEVRQSTLLESFKSFIRKSERHSLEKLLSKKALSEEETNNLWEMFTDCNITQIPTVTNIEKISLMAAKYGFIQRPFFVLSKIRKGMGSFWNGFTATDIDVLWNSHRPTVSNCLNYFTFDEPLLPAKEKVASFIKRFIAGTSEEILSLLLQFATGAANIERGSGVQVRFVNQYGCNLVITSEACFKILTLPRLFEIFKQFKTVIEGTLLNPLMWEMND